MDQNSIKMLVSSATTHYYSNQTCNQRMDQHTDVVQTWQQVPVSNIKMPDPSPIGYTKSYSCTPMYNYHVSDQIWNMYHSANVEGVSARVVHKNEKTKRCVRTTYTAKQLLELEKEFLRSRFTTPAIRSQLADALNLTEKQIKVWFQNRRTKQKMKTSIKNTPDEVTSSGEPSKAKPKIRTTGKSRKKKIEQNEANVYIMYPLLSGSSVYKREEMYLYGSQQLNTCAKTDYSVDTNRK